MEAVGDEEYFDSFQEAVEEEVRQPADATDPLAPDAEEPESDPISLARPIELDSGGKIKAVGAGKLVLIFFVTKDRASSSLLLLICCCYR